MREPIPLAERKHDILILAFFWLNILFITYQVDIEQLLIKDPSDFEYPIWPLRPVIDTIHWWGETYDPALMARPVWFKMTIWIDQLFFGPFYVFAIYAYTRGREWIRVPSFIFASVMITNVVIILGEEFAGAHATPNFPMVLFANTTWILMPAFIIARMWRDDRPFTREAATT